jgi:hypothetical protein
MRRWAIRIAALALSGGPAAAPASVMITPWNISYIVDGWAMECSAAMNIFDTCEAEKTFGGARVKLAVVGYAITASVGTKCKGRPEIAGEQREWGLDEAQLNPADAAIVADIDRARAACGQKALPQADRAQISDMVRLLFGLRPGPRDEHILSR